jgi:hypothetical protein
VDPRVQIHRICLPGRKQRKMWGTSRCMLFFSVNNKYNITWCSLHFARRSILAHGKRNLYNQILILLQWFQPTPRMMLTAVMR